MSATARPPRAWRPNNLFIGLPWYMLYGHPKGGNSAQKAGGVSPPCPTP